jgi:hypothetical protein
MNNLNNKFYFNLKEFLLLNLLLQNLKFYLNILNCIDPLSVWSILQLDLVAGSRLHILDSLVYLVVLQNHFVVKIVITLPLTSTVLSVSKPAFRSFFHLSNLDWFFSTNNEQQN